MFDLRCTLANCNLVAFIIEILFLHLFFTCCFEDDNIHWISVAFLSLKTNESHFCIKDLATNLILCVVRYIYIISYFDRKIVYVVTSDNCSGNELIKRTAKMTRLSINN